MVNPTDLDFKKAKVYRNTTNNPSTADLIGETVSNTFTDTNLPDSATRHYWVTAVDNVGNESSKFGLGSPTTDAAFPKGEKGDAVKGQKGEAVKGQKGDAVKGQKGQEGDAVKGQKGQGGDKGQKGQGDKGSQGDPAYPAFGRFAYYFSTSDTTPNADGRIFSEQAALNKQPKPVTVTGPTRYSFALMKMGEAVHQMLSDHRFTCKLS